MGGEGVDGRPGARLAEVAEGVLGPRGDQAGAGQDERQRGPARVAGREPDEQRIAELAGPHRPPREGEHPHQGEGHVDVVRGEARRPAQQLLARAQGAARGVVGGLQQQPGRPVWIPRLRVQRRRQQRILAEVVDDGGRSPGHGGSLRRQHRLEDGLTGERVGEADHVRLVADCHQPPLDRGSQRLEHPGLRQSSDPAEQPPVDGSAQHRGGLHHGAHVGIQCGEPGVDDAGDRRRNGAVHVRRRRPPIGSAHQRPRVHEPGEDLLDEERQPVGVPHDVAEHLLR
jgi:hypothetical protein